MADQPQPEKKSSFGFLTRKLGPLPVWAWGAIAFGAYYWYTHYGPGAKKAAAAAAAQKQPRGQRPQVIVVSGGNRRKPPGTPRAGQAPLSQPQPVQATAPMTAGAVYGNGPVAGMDGSTWNPTSGSGIPSDTSPPYFAGGGGGEGGPWTEGQYVPAA